MLARTHKAGWLSQAFFHQRFELGDAAFTATLFGKGADNLNWSLLQLKADHPDHKAYAERLGEVLYDLRVGKALAPNVTKFTDRIIDSRELDTPIKVGSMTVHRNYAEGMEADGVPLAPGEALIMSTANCPVTVMECDGGVLALHTGRECLIDRTIVAFDEPTEGRKYHSVCFNAVFRLNYPARTRVKVFWAEPPSSKTLFRNEGRYKDFNPKLYDLVRERWGSRCVPGTRDAFHLLLPELIRAQCMELGVPAENIDLTSAHQPTRGTWLDGTPGAPRNLVVINRLS